MHIRLQPDYNNSVSVGRCPLVYALQIGERWNLIKGEPPHGDWEVYPTTPWNYALEVDPDAPEKSLALETSTVGDCPFSPEQAPVRLHARGVRIDAWELEKNAAATPPTDPPPADAPREAITLLPYGCTNLRLTEMPAVRPPKQS